MPNRTDDPPRTRPPTATRPVSRPRVSPAIRSALQPTTDPLLTQESFQAICSSHERAGRWEAADEIQVRAIAGDVTLDFTRADLPPSGMVEIDAWAIAGHIRIIVPDGAEIELNGTPVLGSIEQKLRGPGSGEHSRQLVAGLGDRDLAASPPRSEPPYFRIDAHAIVGVIEVTGS